MRKLFLFITALTLSVGVWGETQMVSYLCPVYNTSDDPTSGIKEWQSISVEATVVTNTITILSTGWYVVSGTDVQTGSLTCQGAVHLILADGAKLTAMGPTTYAGIQVSGEGNSLTIYAQSTDAATMGQLIANGGNSSSGIGGGLNGSGSYITINGGVVTANGGKYASGIGGGLNGSGSYITINGGVVTANGSEYSAAGIGGGGSGSGSYITINGGTVTATGGSYGAGIGGGSQQSGFNITINGGTVTATGGEKAAGIGGGFQGSGSNIKIATRLQIKADNNNPPTTEIENTGGDLASSLTGKRYAVLHDLLPDIKEAAIAEIYAAIVGVTDETILAIATQAKTNIGNATTEEAINSIKTLALAKINALYQILIARQGIQNAEINSMINDAVNIISNATDTERITDAMLDAMTVIGLFQNGKAEGIEQGRAEALGSMGEPCTDCPAVEVKKGTKTVKLYNPEKVEFKKE